MDTIEYIKEATTDSSTPWVLYRNGTLVFLPGASGYLEKLASDLLKTEGPVVAGTPSGEPEGLSACAPRFSVDVYRDARG